MEDHASAMKCIISPIENKHRNTPTPAIKIKASISVGGRAANLSSEKLRIRSFI